LARAAHISDDAMLAMAVMTQGSQMAVMTRGSQMAVMTRWSQWQ
jgi:hypothetical protein